MLDGSAPYLLGRRFFARWALATLCVLSGQVGAAEQPVYSFAVVPQFQAVEISRVWQPLLDRIGQMAKITLVLKTSRDIPAFEAEVLAGQHDFAYLNPYHQVMAYRAHRYVPLLRDNKLLQGIVVVRKDALTQDVAQLEGQSLAFPAPNAFGASLLIRAELAETRHMAIKPVYAKTHTNAYRHTLIGLTAASGGVRATLAKEPQEVQQALRILMETPGFAPHPVSAHPRVPREVRRAVVQAMITLSKDPSMRTLFQDIPMTDPVEADQARDYQPLERLNLEKYIE